MYEILDSIADSYVPGLLICFIFLSVVNAKNIGKTKILKSSVLLVIFLIFSYGFMALDKYFGWYAGVGLDYSTHTALSVSLVIAIQILVGFRYWVTISLLVYFLLMLYQQYHTVADIVTTLLLVVPFIASAYFMLRGNLTSK